jgi:pimeloyl-ACP methyl ester carboxylesterase
MNFFESSVGRLAYVDQGQGPHALIFLHNGGDCSDLWLNQVQQFSKTHRVLAPDLIGFGQSDRSLRALTIEVQLKALNEWMNHLKLGNHTIVGNCIGAAIAIQLATAAATKPRQLVLVNVCIGAQGLAKDLAITSAFLSKSRALGTAVIGLLSKIHFINQRIQKSTWVIDDTEGNPVFKALAKNSAHRQQAQSRMGLVLGLNSFDSWWNQFHAPTPAVPTHLFWGSKNPVIPLATGLKVRDRLQPLSFVEFKGSGHLPMAEEPELFNQELAKLL